MTKARKNQTAQISEQPDSSEPPAKSARTKKSSASNVVAAGNEQDAICVIAENKSPDLQLLVHRRFKQMQLRFDGEVPEKLQMELAKKRWKFRPEEHVYTKQWGFDGESAATELARCFLDELCQWFGSTTGKRRHHE